MQNCLSPMLRRRKLGCRGLSADQATRAASVTSSRLPFMVRLHNDPNPKVRQNVKVKNMKKLQNEPESTKKHSEKKEIFLRMINNFLKNDSILICFPTSSKIHQKL
jgi:hypothetical protein